MALLKSCICLVGTPSCQSRHIFKILNNEPVSFKPFRINYNARYIASSALKKSRRGIFPSKMSKGPAQLASEEAETMQKNPFSISLLVKPFFFTVAFSSASLAGTAIWQYENIRKKAILLMKKSWLNDKFFKYRQKKYTWRQEFNKLWNQLTEGEKLFAPICVINVLIFLAWKVKRFQPTMIKYFCSNPFGEAVCWPMVLTIFSHFNFFHLAANMYVLHSFSTSGVEVLGKEQFLGLYLAAGVISSFTSYLYKALKSQQSLSLGASGAIMAMVAYICAKYPDTKLSIILLPWFVFSAGNGIKCIMALDILGVLRGWKYFDHAAHLGGAFCGVGWCYWGNTYIWQKREPLLHWWHEIRSPSK